MNIEPLPITTNGTIIPGADVQPLPVVIVNSYETAPLPSSNIAPSVATITNAPEAEKKSNLPLIFGIIAAGATALFTSK